MNLANRITLFRILLIPLFIVLFPIYPEAWVNQFSILAYLEVHGVFYAAVVFIVASITDKLDGYVARKYNQTTNLGKLLDPLADKLLVAAALILMVSLHMIPSWIAFLILAREVIMMGVRIAASAQKVALAADKYGKWKMVLQVAAISAILLNNAPFSMFTSFPVDLTLMYGALVITVYSGYNYIKNNYQLLQLEAHTSHH
ncbi:CDP-diacylglycerol--glycerol-3-phosphate 3-phosphatidyltransferase [Paenibacillus sp. FSL M7-0420]|uniref:CDP-diacylglycerol--glycerol-3-phosphate 3-phosphatidyltransferase n=1 Tax=Paenibacillus sp. FSL M7-0420 TaxID=2921609 RepID=UPI0030F7D0D4